MANTKEKIEYEYTGSVTSLKKATSKASGLLASFEDAARKTFKALSGLSFADVMASSIKESLDYVENLNLFNVAMGDSIGVGREFVSTMQEIYGMDPSNIMEYAGNFYQLTSAVNTTKEASEVMSLQLTKAANDISSLFNVDIDTVISNLSSGLRGMSRAVAKYGMDIRVTTLQATAASLGITKQVETMSEADREGLRYITMMKQASNAMGDFAKTIESPANQLRIFKEQITQLARAVGNFFLPVLQNVLPYINGFVMAVRTMLTYAASLMGITDLDFGGSVSTIEDEADALDSLGNSAEEATDKLKELVAPFDELNVLNNKQSDFGMDSDSLMMDPRIEEAIKNLQVEFENVRMKANDVRDDILKFFGFEEVDGKLKFIRSSFENNLINRFPQWTNTIRATFDNWNGIVDGFKAVWKAAVGVVKQVLVDIKNAIITLLGGDEADANVAEWISNIPQNLQEIADWINEHKEGIAKFIEIFAGLKVVGSIIGGIIGKVSSLVSVGKGLSGIFSFLGLGGSGSAAAGAGGALAGVAGPVAIILAIVAALAAAYATSEDFRESVNSLFSEFGKVLKDVWDNVLQPIFETLGSIISDLWYNTILPILEPLMEIIADLAPLISSVISKITEVVGPFVPYIINIVITPIKTAVKTIGAVLEAMLTSVRDTINILKKIANGDWSGAWDAFKEAAKNSLKSAYKVIYSILNSIWDHVKSYINGVGELVGHVKGWFGGDESPAWNITATLPSPDELFMASGGVVTGPTRAVIGEGQYDEAVIPLGESPQLDDMLNRFASKVSERPIEVKVIIGDKEWNAFTYKANQKGSVQVGATPLGVF